MLCKTTLLVFNAGKLLPQVVKKENDEEESSKRHLTQENKKEKFPPKKPNLQSATLSKYDANSEKKRRREIYEKEMSAFNIQFPDFIRYQVNHIKASFSILKYFPNSSQIPFELSEVASLNISHNPEKWTLIDVSGAGKFWIYATLISGLYSSAPKVRINLFECRENISDLLKRVSRLSNEEITIFLREMGLVSQKGVKLKSLSDVLHFRNLPEMLSALLRVGTLGNYLWQGDLGEELDLLAPTLGQYLLSFSNVAAGSSTGRGVLDSDIGPLQFLFCYDPYPCVSTNNPIYPFNVLIVHTVNHFRALVAPQNYDFSKICSFLPQ